MSADPPSSSSYHPFQAIHDALRQITNVQEVLQSPLSNQHVQTALTHLQQVQLDHLQIDRESIQRLTAGQCMVVFESRHFEIAAFLLPAGFKLHLHDHPNMVVCSRLLHGAALIRSYSRVKKRKNGDVDARLEVDMEKTASDEPWMLTPRQGNYHEITPQTECVMLDILLPPYDDEQRQCNFYEARKKGGAEGVLEDSSDSNNSSNSDLLKGGAGEAGTSAKNSPISGSPRASSGGNYLLRKLSHGEQMAVELPYAVTYQGFRPRE